MGSVQFISLAQLCPTLCDPMNRSTPGLPVHHQLLEFTQTHVHRVCDTIQPSVVHPLSSPSPPSPNPSQHQGLFQWVSSSHEVAKVLEFQPQHQSFCASPQISSYSSPGQLLFHVTLQTMKQKVSRFQGPWWKKVQSLSALLSKPLKDSLHPYQRGEGIMMIICSIVQGKGEKRWNVVSAKSDKLGWLISIQKSPFSSIQLMPTKHLWCARLRDGNFCFYRGRRLGFLDSSAEITIQLT